MSRVDLSSNIAVFAIAAELAFTMAMAASADQTSSLQLNPPQPKTDHTNEVTQNGDTAPSTPQGKTCKQLEVPPPLGGKGNFEMIIACW